MKNHESKILFVITGRKNCNQNQNFYRSSKTEIKTAYEQPLQVSIIVSVNSCTFYFFRDAYYSFIHKPLKHFFMVDHVHALNDPSSDTM